MLFGFIIVTNFFIFLLFYGLSAWNKDGWIDWLIDKELEQTLEQDISTRWNSQFFLLQSLATQLNKGVLAASKQYEKLEL